MSEDTKETATVVEAEDGKATEDGGAKALQIILNVVLVAVIIVTGVVIMIKLEAMKKPPPRKPVVPRMLKVQVADITVGEYRVTVTGNGTVAAKNEINIIPEVSGKLTYVNPEFREGGFVDRGEVLFRIEQSDYVEARNQILAGIAASEAEIAYQKDRKASLGKELALAKKTWEISNQESERLRRLYEKKAASEAELNRTLLSEQSAKQVVEQYKSNIELIDPGIVRIEAQLESARAQLAKADLSLSRTEYKMPFTGRVSCGGITEGQFVGAGQPLCRVQDVSVYEIPVPLSLSDWHALAPGIGSRDLETSPMPVEVVWKNDAGRPYVWPGKVVRMSSTLNRKTRMADLVVEVRDDGDRLLRPGMFCEVTFKGQTLEGVTTVPRRALRENDTVYLAGPDNKLEIKNVDVWRRSGERVVIKGGLEAGDQVITSVVEEAVPGMAVAVISRNGKKVSGEPRAEDAHPAIENGATPKGY